MLDEWKEFELYTTRPCVTELMTYELLRNKQAGMYSVMTAVARGFIGRYMEKELREGGDRELGMIDRCTRRCLKAWCGLCEYTSRDLYYELRGYPERAEWVRTFSPAGSEGRVYIEIGSSCLGRLNIEVPRSAGGDTEEIARFRERFRQNHSIIYDDNVCEDHDACLGSEESSGRYGFISGLRGFFPEYVLRMHICPLLPEGCRELVRAGGAGRGTVQETESAEKEGKKRPLADRINLLAERCGYERPAASQEALNGSLSKKELDRLAATVDMLSTYSRTKRKNYLYPELDKRYDKFSDLNRITYSRVTAAALDLGSPKRYRLCCDIRAGLQQTGGMYYTEKKNRSGKKKKHYLYDISERDEAVRLRKEIIGKLNSIIGRLSKTRGKCVKTLLGSVERHFAGSGIDEICPEAQKGGRPRVCVGSLNDILDEKLKGNKQLSDALGGETVRLRELMAEADMLLLRSYPPELSGLTDKDGIPLKKSDQQIALKTLCCFLLSRGDRDVSSVPFTKAEVILWQPVTDKTAALNDYRIKTGGGTEPLFRTEHYAGKMLKLSVNERWLGEYNWRLSDDEDTARESRGGTVTAIYTDHGAGAYMTRSEAGDGQHGISGGSGAD